MSRQIECEKCGAEMGAFITTPNETIYGCSDCGYCFTIPRIFDDWPTDLNVKVSDSLVSGDQVGG